MMHPDGEFVRILGDGSYKWVADVNSATLYTARLGRSLIYLDVDPPLDDEVLANYPTVLILVPVRTEKA